MSIASITQRNVVSIVADADLVEAAETMRKEHVGYLIVFAKGEAGEPIGVLTDRDIVVEVVAKDVSARAVTVGDAMTANPLTLHENTSAHEALQRLRDFGVRRAPVVNANGDLVGVLALDDVLAHLADELVDVAAAIRHEQLIERVERH